MITKFKPTDLASISSVLKHLPAVLGSFQNDDFLGWNSAVQKGVGLSEDELDRTPLSSLLIFEGNEEDTLGELVLKGFNEGRRLGCEEERNRTRHFFHDVLSSKILVASFLAHEIYQQLAESGAEQTENVARLTKLLQEAIDAIVLGAEDNWQPNVECVSEP